MRPTRTAIEPGGNTSPRERMLQETVVMLWRPDEDGDVVERHATTRLFEHPPGDLNRLATLSRRGEELERSVEVTTRRRRFVEQMAAQAREIAQPALRVYLDQATSVLQDLGRFPVMRR